MHPRITVNPNVFSKADSLESDIARLQRLGVKRFGLHRVKLQATGTERTIELVRGSGLSVTHFVHSSMFTLEHPGRWEDESRALLATIDVASALGVGLIYGTSGPGGALTWEAAVAALSEAVAPAREHARRKGVTLLIETTNPQFADIDIFHTLRDTVAGAESAQLGVCLDIHASWTESALQQSITRAAPITQLVQISDYVPGTRDLDRAVPGDGEIPLARILGWIEQAGYDGPLDIELRDTSGRGDQDQALLRAIERTGELLDDLAA